MSFDGKLAEVGAVVFTNGGLDQWSAGSVTVAPPGAARTAAIVFEGGAYTTDTATKYNNTCEPPEYRAQRAEALDAAMAWAAGGGAPASGATGLLRLVYLLVYVMFGTLV